jgi:hypothetical protein
LALTNVGLVVEETDDGSAVGAHYPGNNCQGNITNLVIFNAGDINDSVGNMYVCSS